MIIRSIVLLLAALSYFSTSITSGGDIISTGSEQYFYRVYFTDKGDESIWDFAPDQLLSKAAVERRERCGIPALTVTDLPVCSEYIDETEQLGLIFQYASKWMNTALFCSANAFDTSKLTALPFVKKVSLVKSPLKSPKQSPDKYGTSIYESGTVSYNPIEPVNGMPLFLSGYTGKGVTIAVLDAGFLDADNVEALDRLISSGMIIKTYDYVLGSPMVYGHHWHGTAVLSIMAGSYQGIINGPATDARYLLMRTEDNGSEFPVEEDYWVAAAEYADSAGADIITSSLGYCTFDDPEMNYTFSDADGNTAFITIAADIAASKGILVVSSAGNERAKSWQRIVFPSDGDSVLCIGAVNQDLTIASFSSSGFSADGRVKPDLVAPGVYLPVQYRPGLLNNVSGTSFSCPVISSMCAALMQAVPGSTASDIIEALKKSSDRFNDPDSLYGYGLPDFTMALKILEDDHIIKPSAIASAGPNPFIDDINIWFRDTPENMAITITDGTGRTIFKTRYTTFIGRSFVISGLSELAQGIYFVKVTTAAGESVFRMIKMHR